uniref:Kinesin family member 20Ba n=1 Tax=Astyanax mexicanus TaxID=7994 RepID=A0A3B1JQS5_ASTMX
MMESCLNDKVSRTHLITVDDLRKDLTSDMTEIAYTQDSSLEREHLQVYLRIRPFSNAEVQNGESQDCVTIQLPDTVLLKAPRTSLSARLSDKSVPQTAQRFQFSKVFGPDSSQTDFFDCTVKSLVKDVLEGQNSLVFTYGVTNAGKTFTFLGPENDVGVLPRSLNMIFNSLEGRIFKEMSLKPHRCLDVLKLTKEQQAEEAISKRNLFRLLKEVSWESGFLACSLVAAPTFSFLSKNRFSLDMDLHSKFSVWVSFCEIYNENIHDLLEQPPSNAVRRTNLRLCQDIKGNSFIKDLRWVQVNSAEEAFKVMKLGKKNQSISSTRLNQLSSRSHSIFSVRILRIEDLGIPRVESVSELSLCDLAGSERCGKTQNKGDRLKEAGNINTSLLSLGKCINALKGNLQAKHHVPFRESKLTHYLQGYFTGRGKACMIVNINQCASMFDETLNVLKFSAVAQKVVVLTTATSVPLVVKKSARKVSLIINNAGQQGARRSSLVRWEHSLEDVQEDADSEEEAESVMEDTMEDSDDEEGKETVLLDKEAYEQMQFIITCVKTAIAENQTLECRIRAEVTKEFSELFSQMQTDYNERISKERELVEERCERRIEIFKKLVGKSTGEADCDGEEYSKPPSLDGMLDSMSCDLAGIRRDAEAAQSCLETSDGQSVTTQSSLEEKVSKLTEQLSEVQRQLTLKTEESRTKAETRKRRQEEEEPEVLRGQPPLKKGSLDNSTLPEHPDNHLPVAEVKGQLESCQLESHKKDQRITDLERELQTLEFSIQEMKSQLQQEKRTHDDVLQEKERLASELSVLQKSMQEQQQKYLAIENKLCRAVEAGSSHLKPSLENSCGSRMTDSTGEEELKATKCRLDEQSREIVEKNTVIRTLEQQVTQLRQEAEQFSSLQRNLEKLQNSGLQVEVETLNGLVSELQEQVKNIQAEHEKEEDKKREAELKNKPLVKQPESKNLAEETDDKLSAREAQLAQKEAALREKEAQLSALQKSLKKAQENLEEEEVQAVQEARRREAERRRELLAVAEEAIAQKDAELLKRQEEINRLKEEAKSSCEKVRSLSVDFERREEESADLKEKLADSKKQIHQVQKEISSMRDAEKTLKQKLNDLEKVKTQLQNELSNRDRTIQQLKSRSSDSKTEEYVQLYEKTCKDLQARERVIEDMRLALTEQEETQNQLDLELDNREAHILELCQGTIPYRAGRYGKNITSQHLKTFSQLRISTQAKKSLNVASEKQQAERKKWLEEKLVLITQAKEAEERRNQDMRRYADDRERHTRQHAEMESLTAQLAERDEEMERWRKERDTLVSALEIQLKKLVSSIAEKDKQIQDLQCSVTLQTPETVAAEDLVIEQPLESSTLKHKRKTRGSVTSQGSCGSYPSVLDSSEVSTEMGRRSRFPRPEVEIAFSSLQPDRFALKRHGEDSSVTVKISRAARKRKSGEMDKVKKEKQSQHQRDGVDMENRRNMRCRNTPRLPAHQEEESSLRGKKEGTLQKIGGFLNSSPTFLGSKAKKIMGLMSGKSPEDSGSLSLKRSKRKLNRPNISSPMDIPVHQIIGHDSGEKTSENLIKRLRTRTPK